MGRELALKSFARAGATFVLAAAISVGLGAAAKAAPGDRAGDPVVLEGSGVSGMLGVAPERIVGFSWNGGWEQVPVQVDQRHTINVRQLYPDTPLTGYIGPTTLGFEIEAYADPKTRSGADADPSFDADDELTFMGGDAGSEAPADAEPPAGVEGTDAVKVAVEDPVAGGGAVVYLFQSAGGLDPAAGKDYVDYDFKLTNLGPGQSIRDDYGYIHSINPEDSTVTTANYQLHSIDRWMEDELKVKAGSSSGVDILDRETAQAYRTQCGRTQYTFSGRWTEDTYPGNDTDTDDEGTYVAAIDGPVRAIRSYMGANSGPYTQREHVYYADREDNTIFLRVHIMQDLYSWTDYSTAAIGMTYRDAKNTAGVPVDGVPDTLVPTTTADITGGAYSWQQLSGAQGTVSTVMGSETDLENPDFGNYYLDDSTPTEADELQCGGDGESIGASGFGILGVNGVPVTPNTDPRLGTEASPANHLTVERVRYFGPPSDGAAQAEAYKERVAKPLAASTTAVSIQGGPQDEPQEIRRAGLRMKLLRKKSKAHKGKRYRVRMRLANPGNRATGKIKVCIRSKSLKRRGTCRKIAAIGAGKARTVKIGARVKPRAKGRKLRIKATARSGKAKARKKLVVRYRRR